ncbi:hypothetical protein I6M70_15050 [Acinetobacter pittii]|uniref:CDI toxin immunity protein n=1 Tax=Acinetobacter pittii TaxID=48296 RepID=UPI001902062B|nr:hypothetical protein [Acinetobacter pittii]MBJ8480675.1 hypothetical protein [Acinetobacter pittii]MCU4342085.1 hypothetical protein [Acinetobacter pittii]MCU4561342.1 hypothetical protein [Acinetobacter pittii]
MLLFEECQEALKDDFYIVEKSEEILSILQKYPMSQNAVLWSNINFIDFEDMEELMKFLEDKKDDRVYVVADDASIPVFSSNLKLIIENIYDVIAICPKIYIFNDKLLLEPLFPSYKIRIGFNA